MYEYMHIYKHAQAYRQRERDRYIDNRQTHRERINKSTVFSLICVKVMNCLDTKLNKIISEPVKHHLFCTRIT